MVQPGSGAGACWVAGDHVPKEYEDLVEPHVQSMNYFLTEGIVEVVDDIKPVEVRRHGGHGTWCCMLYAGTCHAPVCTLGSTISHQLCRAMLQWLRKSTAAHKPGPRPLPSSVVHQSLCPNAALFMQVTHPITKHTYRFWLSDPKVGRPVKEGAAAGVDERLWPWECREEVGHTLSSPISSVLSASLHTEKHDSYHQTGRGTDLQF